MKCMGDFGEGYDIETEDLDEAEMGFRIKIKKPKIKFKAPKISVPKIISKPIAAITKPISAITKPVTSVLTPITKPVASITQAVVRNPLQAVTTGVATTMLPTAIVASAIPGVNKIVAPVTDVVKTAASPVTNVVAPIALAPVSMVSSKLAESVYTAAMPTQPKMQAQVEEVYEEEAEVAPVLDTAPATLVSKSQPQESSNIISNSSPTVTINSQAKPVLDTTPATLVPVTKEISSAKEEKKGGGGMVVGGLVAAGIAAYFLMRD